MGVGTRAGRSAYVCARRASPRERDPTRGAGRGPLRLWIPGGDRGEPAGAGGPEADHPRERPIFGLGPPAPCGVAPLALTRAPDLLGGPAPRPFRRHLRVPRMVDRIVGGEELAEIQQVESGLAQELEQLGSHDV